MAESEWSPYVVQQGDHVRKLAFRCGAKPDEVWAHAKNKDLASRRTSMDMLCPGDVIFLPKGSSVTQDITAGTKNRYKAKVPTVAVKLKLASQEGEVGGQPYEVHGIPGAPEPLLGTTGGGGELELELPVWVREVLVKLPEMGVALDVSVGDLDPMDEPSGVKQRLRNLGYLRQEGEMSDELFTGAVASYQRDRGLTVTGNADQATLDALKGDVEA